MNRITDKFLDARLSTVNKMLGYGEDPDYSVVGSVTFNKAYGSTGVAQYVNESGGVRTLLDLGTKREAYIFLNGMITSLRILDTNHTN